MTASLKPGGMCVWCKRTTATEGGAACSTSPMCNQSVMPPGTVHRPFTDDGVTYCGWDGHEGCGEVWPCPTVLESRSAGER